MVARLFADLAALGQGIEGLAVDVELELVGGGVAGPDRVGAAVALEVVQDLLGQMRVAVDPVHDLEGFVVRSFACAQTVAEPVGEAGRLLHEAEVE